MHLCFFDDDFCARFHPLTLTRPVDDLRLGSLTLGEKWRHALTHVSSGSIVRDELQPLFPSVQPAPSQASYWINPRFLPSQSLVKKVENLAPGTCIQKAGITIAAHADAAITAAWVEDGRPDFSAMLVLEGGDFPSVGNLWDLFLMNADEIANDITRLKFPRSDNHAVSPNAILQNKEQIFIGEGATVEPGAMLIAQNGPVFIGKDATVMAGAMIRGPVAICENATIKMGAKIYGGTTIGPVCKVGGEISNSIFHSYSNKGHDGFVGNSLIGQWCNLGADTNTSNLKNNYSTIRITDWQSRNEIETGQQFLGTVMGDHTKTAINTQLNTGTVCGVSCNIFSGDFPPKFIPSFSWVGSNVIQPYKIDKALQTMQAMMVRRDVPLEENYEKMMRYLFTQAHP